MIVEKFKNISPGDVRTFFCPDTEGILSGLESSLSSGSSDINLVCCSWKTIPGLDDLLEDIINGLARMALKMWPDWPAVTPEEGGSEKWIEQATLLCQEDKNPLPGGFSRSVQAQQLSEIMGPSQLIVVLGLENNGVDRTHIFSFVKACQWIASESSARVVVLLPPEFSDLEEIEAISYGAVRYYGSDPEKDTATRSWLTASLAGSTHYPGIWEKKPGQADEKKASTPLPELGVPHPLSQGEQLIAAAMAGDPGLSALFEFNRMVKTHRGKQYIVDLLWKTGRVVVEIDGYTFHGTRCAFASDRNRDYELMISGYLVLRIPHWEVMDDPGHALKKMRDIVEFRKKEGLHGVEP